MRYNFLFSIILAFVFITSLSAQEDVQVGSLKYTARQQTGFFDFSDPTGINIKVQIWGYVKYPGFYVIPAHSALNDLISLAGGPTEDALLDDIRILRTKSDSSTMTLKYNYDDLLWGDKSNISVKFPRIFAGDMMIIPGEPRYFAREDVRFYISITTALATIAAIIISITK